MDAGVSEVARYLFKEGLVFELVRELALLRSCGIPRLCFAWCRLERGRRHGLDMHSRSRMFHKGRAGKQCQTDKGTNRWILKNSQPFAVLRHCIPMHAR